ncbi:hypothetical protein EVAR_82122_1 [Eumeta japonica]|uniref:Uncharacterized protein n=1 Tax=Eumeta variegata TaxID=151549 RepID=A0A4C1U1T8_EUMVA|nr:hypothetical protein EVAR_82122_1 [Eumeta japonica]
MAITPLTKSVQTRSRSRLCADEDVNAPAVKAILNIVYGKNVLNPLLTVAILGGVEKFQLVEVVMGRSQSSYNRQPLRIDKKASQIATLVVTVASYSVDWCETSACDIRAYVTGLQDL